MIKGREFAENQYEEKLYSTGDEYLDELLEKAFCEGYEYAQKEFARAISKQKMIEELQKRVKNGDKNAARMLKDAKKNIENKISGIKSINSSGSKYPYFGSPIEKERYLKLDTEGRNRYVNKMIRSRSELKGGASREDISQSLEKSQGRKARRGDKDLQRLYDHGEMRPESW